MLTAHVGVLEFIFRFRLFCALANDFSVILTLNYCELPEFLLLVGRPLLTNRVPTAVLLAVRRFKINACIEIMLISTQVRPSK